MPEKEAMLYRRLDDGRVNCCLCTNRCDIAEAGRGLCGARENRGGRLFTRSYGKALAVRAEPIERSRLYHVLPGTKSFTVTVEGALLPFPGGGGGTFDPPAPADRGTRLRELPPPELVRAALEQGCDSIVFTYSRPTLSYEYVFDTARIAKRAKILNLMVTRGDLTVEALTAVAPYLDACSVEIGSTPDSLDRNVPAGSPGPVFECVRSMRQLGIWVEVSTTIRPGRNDSSEELEGIARFISGLDRNIPWHVARGYSESDPGESRMTPLETLWRAYSIGRKERLRYIYIRNVLAEVGETLCPFCGRSIIFRRDFAVEKLNLAGSRCRECGREIPGIFEAREHAD